MQVKNLKRMKKQVERERGAEEAASYDFFPTTFILPSEYQMFVEEFKRSSQVSTLGAAHAFVADGPCRTARAALCSCMGRI